SRNDRRLYARRDDLQPGSKHSRRGNNSGSSSRNKLAAIHSFGHGILPLKLSISAYNSSIKGRHSYENSDRGTACSEHRRPNVSTGEQSAGRFELHAEPN